MRNKMSFLITVIVLTGIFFIAQSFVFKKPVSQNQTAEQIKKLEQKIDSLSTKVLDLEKKVSKLEKRQYIGIPRPYFRSPKGKLPPEWKQYEFNGTPYYMVPLTKENLEKRIKK